MGIEELNNLIHKVQQNEQIHKHLYLNVPLWSIIKAPLYGVLLNKIGGVKIDSPSDKILKKTTITNSLYRLIKAKLTLLIKSKTYYSQFDGIMFVNVIAKKNIDNKIVFNFSDIIINETNNIKYLLIHNDKGYDYSIELKHKPTFYSSPFRFPPIIYISKSDKKKFKELVATLEKALKEELYKEDYPEGTAQFIIENLYHKKVISHLYNFEKEYKRFSKFLNKYTPKFIYLTNSQSHAGIILAAKQNKIPIIELQHGLFTPTHRVYDWPQSYRNKLNLIPDYFFVWGDYWKQVLLKQENYWRENAIISVGNPSFDSFREIFFEKKNNKNTKNRVLITSNYLVAEQLSSFLMDFFEKFYSQLLERGYVFNIKLHITEHIHSNYEEINRKFNKIAQIVDRGVSFADALNQNEYLLSTFSVTLFESVALGKKTATIDLLESAKIINSLPTIGIESIKSIEELYHYLVESQFKENQIDTNFLFKRNASLNINNSIKRITKESL